MLVLLLAFICLAGAAAAAVQALTIPVRERDASLRRARSYGDTVATPARRPLGASLSTRYGSSLARLATRIDPRATTDRIGLRLVAAGMARKMSPTGFLASKIVAAAAGLILGGFLGIVAGRPGRALLYGVVFGVVGFFVPDMTLTTKTRSRRETIKAQLPDALDILAISVEAGLGFDAALAKVAEHMDGPLVEELQLTLAQMRLGESRQDALRSFADRVDIAEVSSFVHSIVQAEQLGSPLGKILRVQAIEARQRRQVAAEERAMKAPVKMIVPTALLIFPAMFIVILGPAVLHFTEAF